MNRKWGDNPSNLPYLSLNQTEISCERFVNNYLFVFGLRAVQNLHFMFTSLLGLIWLFGAQFFFNCIRASIYKATERWLTSLQFSTFGAWGVGEAQATRKLSSASNFTPAFVSIKAQTLHCYRSRGWRHREPLKNCHCLKRVWDEVLH